MWDDSRAVQAIPSGCPCWSYLSWSVYFWKNVYWRVQKTIHKVFFICLFLYLLMCRSVFMYVYVFISIWSVSGCWSYDIFGPILFSKLQNMPFRHFSISTNFQNLSIAYQYVCIYQPSTNHQQQNTTVSSTGYTNSGWIKP